MFQASAQKDKVAPSALSNPATASCIASDAGAEIMVSGMLRPVRNRIELSVSAIRTQDAKEIFKAKIDFDHSPEVDKLESEMLPESRPARAPVPAGSPVKVKMDDNFAPGIPDGGEKGFTTPRCAYCPAPQYSTSAFRNREQGTVVVDVVIGPDGKAHSVTIQQGLSCGLNQQALDAIENVYRFTPANGPDGKPAAVRMLFEIEFRLY
ncbi:MAG TPA: energy transducer TonB [Candidatus Acidoferrales bacterium]|nr:energy transducer TonB [Candidatus Acidoferrales bacterium]